MALVVLGACGAPSAPHAARPESTSGSSAEPAPLPAEPPPPSRAALVRAERAAVRERGHEVAAERDLILEGPRRLHLVLEAGACYRAHALAESGPVALRLVDEHEHEVARGRGERRASLGGPGGVCPRWSGSFALELTGPTGAAATVVLERFSEG